MSEHCPGCQDDHLPNKCGSCDELDDKLIESLDRRSELIRELAAERRAREELDRERVRGVRMIREAISEQDKHRPFAADPAKDYYRAQWDALVYVLENIFGEEL